MANVWFTSDWHWGHRNACKFRKEFESVEQMMEVTARNYSRVVSKRDKVFFLGDMCFTEEALSQFSELGGNKVLILGNHDTDDKKRPHITTLLEVFNEVHSLYKYKDIWLSHAPMHPDELRGKKNVHGHTHYYNLDDPRYLNVCLEQTDWTPIDIHEVRKRYSQKGVDVLHGVADNTPKPQFMGEFKR